MNWILVDPVFISSVLSCTCVVGLDIFVLCIGGLHTELRRRPAPVLMSASKSAVPPTVAT